MFLRYFYLIFGGPTVDIDVEADRLFQKQNADERVAVVGGRLNKPMSGWELVTWDIGVGCLALSIKVRFLHSLPTLPEDYVFFVVPP